MIKKFYETMMFAYNQTNFPYEALEIDYYVTMLLKLLSDKIPYIVFKGGTSLSK